MVCTYKMAKSLSLNKSMTIKVEGRKSKDKSLLVKVERQETIAKVERQETISKESNQLQYINIKAKQKQ